MTQLDSGSVRRSDLQPADSRPSRFGSILVVSMVVPVVALFAVPQRLLAWPFGLVLLVLLVAGGGAATGAAVAVVLRTAGRQDDIVPDRSAIQYVVAAGLCFFTLCIVGPAAWLLALNWWNGWQGLDARGVAMTAVVAGALEIAAVFAVAGVVLLATRKVRVPLAWAKVDLAVQVAALGTVLAAIAILY